ncbi:exodeoxyribonuclease VII large subunit [Sporosarcina sp. BI001-red]|uniref:exodeoxyribonuclease VII large subunit n=1 Tax=Sporosarcina sp. BI001-red TaxID=2282866 RepID=UPI000E266638|nr:exodeoxyribonuclease VII large subunit [Sporosarcina sp. BI001-red]REB10062.1 exodeoxyribonuclease VII large subunit [Sporosarcina sp. BI001-red]
MSGNPYLTVQAVTKYIKRKFDADPHLRNVYIKGELSNVKIHPSGHIYFTLKDDKSRIQSAMFRGNASSLKFKPESGMNVLITGDINVYESSGQYQLYVQSMEPDGIGALFLAFEQLKEQLGKEGLFDVRWKQQLPWIPKKVGVVTAKSGAAFQDICSTIGRRFPMAEIVLFPAVVQGEQAVPSIVEAIGLADKQGDIDVLIVGRGGGSIEDLWAFNEEAVARAIFSCRIPTISAVGHETDTTIADFVADHRAPTPTAAAELAVPAKDELAGRILDRKRVIYRFLATRLTQEQKRLDRLKNAYPFLYPDRLYRPFIEKQVSFEERLARSHSDLLYRKSTLYSQINSRFQYVSPAVQLQQLSKESVRAEERLLRAMRQALGGKQDRFLTGIRMLQALNPLSVMERGFTIVYKEGDLVKNAGSLTPGDRVEINLQDGTAIAEIQTIESLKEES